MPGCACQSPNARRPGSLLPTMGGQTALNCALGLEAAGVLEKYGVEMIGANPAAIQKAESREEFNEAMTKIGLNLSRAHVVRSMEDGWKAVEDLGYPVVIRPAFTLGGSGGGFAYNKEEFEKSMKTFSLIYPLECFFAVLS